MSEAASPWSERGRSRRQIAALVLTIIAHLLLLLMLIKLAPQRFGIPGSTSRLTTFTVAPDAQEQQATPHKTAAAKAHQATVSPPQPTVPPPVIPPPKAAAAPWVIMPGLEHFDISKVPSQSQPSNTASDASAADEGTGAPGDDQPVGKGPDGKPMYDAEWYRHPTAAEIDPYLPRGKTGYGEIVCRTVERYHVDDCEQLSETLGSGLSRAARLAAFQFLVRPPRVGGHVMVGAWVRIHLDITEEKVDR
jgi:hypothetical protein